MLNEISFIESIDSPCWGIVDLAECRGMRVAIKRTQHQNREDFSQALAAYQLRMRSPHPNIASVLDVRAHEERLITEVLYEFPVQKLNQSSKELSEHVRDFIGMLSALSMLQTQELFHGDVRPENILHSEDGRTLLVERVQDPLSALQRQMRHVQQGHRLYLPPQLFEDLTSQKASLTRNPWKIDAFALGLVFLEGVNGEEAFQGLYDRVRKVFVKEKLEEVLHNTEKRHSYNWPRAFFEYLRNAVLVIDEREILPPVESLRFLSTVAQFKNAWENDFKENSNLLSPIVAEQKSTNSVSLSDVTKKELSAHFSKDEKSVDTSCEQSVFVDYPGSSASLREVEGRSEPKQLLSSKTSLPSRSKIEETHQTVPVWPSEKILSNLTAAENSQVLSSSAPRHRDKHSEIFLVSFSSQPTALVQCKNCLKKIESINANLKISESFKICTANKFLFEKKSPKEKQTFKKVLALTDPLMLIAQSKRESLPVSTIIHNRGLKAVGNLQYLCESIAQNVMNKPCPAPIDKNHSRTVSPRGAASLQTQLSKQIVAPTNNSGYLKIPSSSSFSTSRLSSVKATPMHFKTGIPIIDPSLNAFSHSPLPSENPCNLPASSFQNYSFNSFSTLTPRGERSSFSTAGVGLIAPHLEPREQTVYNQKAMARLEERPRSPYFSSSDVTKHRTEQFEMRQSANSFSKNPSRTQIYPRGSSSTLNLPRGKSENFL